MALALPLHSTNSNCPRRGIPLYNDSLCTSAASGHWNGERLDKSSLRSGLFEITLLTFDFSFHFRLSNFGPPFLLSSPSEWFREELDFSLVVSMSYVYRTQHSNSPKLRSTSSPNIMAQHRQIRPLSPSSDKLEPLGSLSYPKDSPSHIFFTSSSSTTTTESSFLDPASPAGITQQQQQQRIRAQSSPTASPMEVLSGRKTPFFMPTTPGNRSFGSSSAGFWSAGTTSSRDADTSGEAGRWSSPDTSYSSIHGSANLQETSRSYQVSQNMSCRLRLRGANFKNLGAAWTFTPSSDLYRSFEES